MNSSESEDNTNSETIDISKAKIMPALGRCAAIGCLYSEETDSFYNGLNAFNTSFLSERKPSSIPSPQLYHSEALTFDVNESFSRDKLLSVSGNASGNDDKINFEGELGSKLKETTETDLKKAHFLLQWKTVMDYYEEAVDTLSFTKQNLDATHFVAGIIWGAEVEIEFEAKINKSNKLDEQSLNSTFHTSIEKPKVDEENKSKEQDGTKTTTDEGNVKGASKKLEASKLEITNKTFSICANGFRTKTMPMAIDTVNVNSVTSSVKHGITYVNEGKGVPIDYYLLPLPQEKSSIDNEEIDDNSLKNIMSQLKNKEQTANRIQFLMREYVNSNYIPIDSLKTIETLRRDICIEIDNAAEKINHRQSRKDLSLEERRFRKEIRRFDKDLTKMLNDLKRLDKFKEYEKHAYLFKQSSSMMNFLLENVNMDVRILYIGSEWKDNVLEDFINSVKSNKSAKNCKLAIVHTSLLGQEDLKGSHYIKISPTGNVNLS